MNTQDSNTSTATDYLEKLKQAMAQLAIKVTDQYSGCQRKVLEQFDNTLLYQYETTSKTLQKTPTLIIYSLVNKPTILDLTAENSLIKKLLASNVNLLLLDWGEVSLDANPIDIQDYITKYLHLAIKSICKRYKVEKINLLGICQGGTFALCYTALYPRYIKNLITMVTPVDFQSADNRISQLIKHVDTQLISASWRVIPGSWLAQWFMLLKPYKNTFGKILQLSEKLENEAELLRFLKVEQWLLDSPNQQANALREFIHCFYQRNDLIHGKIKLGKRLVKLQKITQPILNLFSSADHIVPASATNQLANYVQSNDYQEYIHPGGHIGIFISKQAQQTVPALIADWLAARDN